MKHESITGFSHEFPSWVGRVDDGWKFYVRSFIDTSRSLKVFNHRAWKRNAKMLISLAGLFILSKVLG